MAVKGGQIGENMSYTELQNVPPTLDKGIRINTATFDRGRCEVLRLSPTIKNSVLKKRHNIANLENSLSCKYQRCQTSQGERYKSTIHGISMAPLHRRFLLIGLAYP